MVKSKKKSARSTGFYLAVGIVVAAIAVVAMLLVQQKNPYEGLPNYGTNECGDLNDPANVQHLSHHPQQYGDCLKQVDSKKFLEATGKNLADFLVQNGIK